MLKVIEGCTCAGKSTLMNKVCSEGAGVPAPEHTPARIEDGEDLYSRQWAVFMDFLKRCIEMDKDPGHTYIADFSPLGVVAFTRALAVLNNDDQFRKEADEMACVCRTYHWDMLTYLRCEPEEICRRLKKRARDTDDASLFSLEFITILCREYDRLFLEGVL